VGGVSRSNTLLLYPLLAALTLSPAKASHGATVTGTIVLRQPAPPDGLTVTLSSGNPTLLSVPGEVRVPGGANSATFQFTAGAVAAESSTVIAASNEGTTRNATLTLVP
jgi:hypothetical protein